MIANALDESEEELMKVKKKEEELEKCMGALEEAQGRIESNIGDLNHHESKMSKNYLTLCNEAREEFGKIYQEQEKRRKTEEKQKQEKNKEEERKGEKEIKKKEGGKKGESGISRKEVKGRQESADNGQEKGREDQQDGEQEGEGKDTKIEKGRRVESARKAPQ